MVLPFGIDFHINDSRLTSTANRTLKERLFTRPWKPFKKTKTIDLGPVIPDGKVFFKDNTTAVVSTKTFYSLKQQIDILNKV